MNHITGPDRDFFWDIAYNDYNKMICALGLDKKIVGLDTVLGIGGPYSYVGNAPQNVINALDYVSGHNMQLSIEYADGKYTFIRMILNLKL